MSTFVLHLQPIASEIPPEVRLRRLLKAALRQHGMRAIDVRQVEFAGPALLEPQWEGEGGASAAKGGANE